MAKRSCWNCRCRSLKGHPGASDADSSNQAQGPGDLTALAPARTRKVVEAALVAGGHVMGSAAAIKL